MLYSSAFLNLEAGPVVLNMPPEPERYVVLGLLHAYSNNYACLGTASHGTAVDQYVIPGLEWIGDVCDFPAGAVRVESSTNLGCVIDRTELYSLVATQAHNHTAGTY